jgi:hypothetical protein
MVPGDKGRDKGKGQGKTPPTEALGGQIADLVATLATRRTGPLTEGLEGLTAGLLRTGIGGT